MLCGQQLTEIWRFCRQQEVIFKIGKAVIMLCVYVCVKKNKCVCVCVQVSQHVNRTAYFSLLSPQAFLLQSSYYIVLHPTSPPLPLFCLLHSLLNHCIPFTLFFFHLHFPLYFFPLSLSCHVFNQCFLPRFAFTVPHSPSPSLCYCQTPAEMGEPVKQWYWSAARQVKIRVRCVSRMT